MLSVDDARERILSTIERCEVTPVDLAESHGLVLAENVVAEHPVPPFRNSAMDGYAIRAADVSSANWDSPIALRVVGELPAGAVPDTGVGSGETIRIMTGAAMPDGADTVVRFEETSEFTGTLGFLDDDSDEWFVEIRKPQKQGANVREAGEDIALGKRVLPAGRVIHAAEMGILASLNFAQVPVYRRPIVGILATGNEVIDPGQPLRRGQIRNSNNYTLAGLVREAGAEPRVLGVARDEVDQLRSALSDASDVDLLLTSGGVSLGDYDVVKDVLQSEGRIELWQVRIKPGKPMAFGYIGNVPLVGLPGNPVAAYIAFLQFARPAIRKMLGQSSWELPTGQARLLVEHENRGNRRHFVRGVCLQENREFVVRPVETQGSGVLTSVTEANCLFIIPEGLDHAPEGLSVEVHWLRE